MLFKKRHKEDKYYKPERRSGVRRKHGTAPELGGPRPWPAGKPPGGELEVKRLSDGTIELTPVED